MLEVSDASCPSSFPSHSDMALSKVFYVMVGLLSATFDIASIFFTIALHAGAWPTFVWLDGSPKVMSMMLSSPKSFLIDTCDSLGEVCWLQGWLIYYKVYSCLIRNS